MRILRANQHTFKVHSGKLERKSFSQTEKVKVKKMHPRLFYAMLLAGAFGPAPKRQPAQKLSKCQLPDCDLPTRHNGGYCCARHCEMHRRILRHDHD